MNRAIAIVVLAAVSALAFRVELAASGTGPARFFDFPMSAFVGTLASAIAMRLAAPVARRSNEDEIRTLLELFVVGTFAFALARWGLVTFYTTAASRVPVPQDWATRMMSIAAVSMVAAFLAAVFGWTASLARTGAPMRTGARGIVGLAMLLVVPSGTAVVALRGERTDLPNVVASGAPTFFTVLYAALAARVSVLSRRSGT